MQLDSIEARVVGSLVEKQLTTPQQYPLTLNALTLACNQTSNRDPVVTLAEAEVEEGLGKLKQRGLVRFILPSHGRSVVRYRHVLDEKLGLDDRQLALVAVLLLRGPQTAGELRQRSERMARFDGVADVESDLAGLARGDTPLVVRLPRRPGQKEERWGDLLAGGSRPGPDAEPALDTPGEVAPREGPEPLRAPAREPGPNNDPGSPSGDAVASLQAEVADLRSEMASLRGELASLRAELDALERELGAG